ncbi:hypothetical protein [Proteiniphilum sp.]|uniref:hypothetical protein n=1 Tax=Proteiniphilum sp. TaxID=1926877 RepID=UPI002B1F5EB0|nr:hypothetical protein [Proteiniphilum sp.]MEA4916538.1 hypothetical protein [Proteiniphilum sp.]MEA4948785.1 hypothetical protein [Petrimonas sp.]
MKTKIFILLISVLLSGCVSRKSAVKETMNLDETSNVDLQVKETASQSSYSDVVKELKTNVSDKSVSRITETEYSEPDSTGRQHKKREIVTETKNDIQTINEENERIISEQKAEIERLTVDNSTLLTRLDASLREETKTATRPPVWTYIVAFIAGVVLTIILRSWLKGMFKH